MKKAKVERDEAAPHRSPQGQIQTKMVVEEDILIKKRMGIKEREQETEQLQKLKEQLQ